MRNNHEVKTVSVEVTCPFCGAVTEVTLPYDGYMLWTSGATVQDAFPNAPKEVREFLISGMCYGCQKLIFGSDDDWDDDEDFYDD